jgi:hypothetical protein
MKPSDQLMAENKRWAAERAVPQKSRDIGTADARDFDRDFCFSVLGVRPGSFLEFNFTGSGINQGTHREKV